MQESQTTSASSEWRHLSSTRKIKESETKQNSRQGDTILLEKTCLEKNFTKHFWEEDLSLTSTICASSDFGCDGAVVSAELANDLQAIFRGIEVEGEQGRQIAGERLRGEDALPVGLVLAEVNRKILQGFHWPNSCCWTRCVGFPH